jgi:RimJ/RimL family protein N-acetyltransferase
MTNSVQLRDVMEADLPIFFEQQPDPDATEMAAFPSRDKEAFMAHWSRIMADNSVILKTIVFDGQVAGNIVSFVQSGESEVGDWIGKAYWGTEIATKALRAFLGHVKTRLLYAQVAKHNIGSRRVLEKCGFTIESEGKGIPNGHGGQVDEFILKLE